MEPGDIFDRYTIERELGRGGMGSVYLSRNRLDAHCVLKVLDHQLAGDLEIRERFKREGRIQFQLRHRNIVRVTDIVEHDGCPALVMDYLKGEDLEQRLARGPLSVEEAVSVSDAMLDALGAAHAAGFIHRDIKPSNVFLEATSKGIVPRLMDFGIAKMTELAAITRESEFMGTPNYSSPEQISSTKDVDASTDIYSWGVVLWEMLSGTTPYLEEKDPISIMMRVVREPLPALPQTVPKWIRDIIDRATCKKPGDRFANTAAFREALTAHNEQDASEQPVDAWASFDAAVADTGNEPSSPVHESELPVAKVVPQSALKSGSSLHTQAPDPHGLTLSTPSPVSSGTHTVAEPSAPAAQSRAPQAQHDEAPPSIDRATSAASPTASPAPQSNPSPQPSAAPLPMAPMRSAPATVARPERKRPRLGRGLAFGMFAVAAGLLTIAVTQLTRPPALLTGMVTIGSDTYQLGSPSSEPQRDDDEPLRDVELTYSFEIQMTEVTATQYTAWTGAMVRSFTACGANCPVVGLSWPDAAAVANAASYFYGLSPCYEITGEGNAREVRWPDGLACEGYRLPTETEWEIAARSGNAQSFPDGDITTDGVRAIDPIGDRVAWYVSNSAVHYASDFRCPGRGDESCGPHEVAMREPNVWGIYDMHGNAAEWTWDWYETTPASGVDPIGPDAGVRRVIRGGGFADALSSCRSAARAGADLQGRSHFGVRLVRTVE